MIDPTFNESRMIAVIEAVAGAEDVDPSELNQSRLYDSVDPDALDRLGSATVFLEFDGYHITSFPDGTVELDPKE